MQPKQPTLSGLAQKYPNMDAGQTPSFAEGDNYWIHIQAEGLVEKYPGKLDSLL